MIGFTNSVTTTLNDRPEHLREVAANEAAVRAARRAVSGARQSAGVLAAVQRLLARSFASRSRGQPAGRAGSKELADQQM